MLGWVYRLVQIHFDVEIHEVTIEWKPDPLLSIVVALDHELSSNDVLDQPTSLFALHFHVASDSS